MNGLNPKLELKFYNEFDVYGNNADSQYDYIIDNLFSTNTVKYTEYFCKSLFYYTLNNLANFEDDIGNSIIRGIELRLYDVEDESTPVLIAKSGLGDFKFKLEETESTLNILSSMGYVLNLFEDPATQPEVFDSGLSDPTTITLSEYPVKNTVTIDYYVNGDASPSGTLTDVNVNIGIENSTVSLDVSSDSNVDSCTIDYVNKTITIDFNDTNVTSVDKIEVTYKKPVTINYYIYKVELYAIMNKVSSSFNFDPDADANGTIERKLLTFDDLSRFSYAQTKSGKDTLPNKGIRLSNDFNETSNGYVKQTLFIESKFGFVWDKRLWA